ncbi:pentatricopeptide repeat-containing protein [Forsythia ovata]|uniref:Pentatricopeptide repeat-containing protein n=1 Tax=Forsythia ovata TaxID=205694 RepID=A0ABD1V0D8_9LAMI
MEEAEKYFVGAKGSGMKLDAVIYTTAVRVACMKLDANVACDLLIEMKKMGWVPSEGTFTHVICTCVKQRNLTDAFRLKDEMISSGYSINLVVATSLMKGYCQQGDLINALKLFNKITEDGLTPNKITYAVLIEGCCRNRNMEKAQVLYTQMKCMLESYVGNTVKMVNQQIPSKNNQLEEIISSTWLCMILFVTRTPLEGTMTLRSA